MKNNDPANNPNEFGLKELLAAANSLLDENMTAVDMRTFRFWRSQNLVSAPNGIGKGAKWTWRHVLETTALRKEQARGKTLKDLHGLIKKTDRQLSKLSSVPLTQPENFQVDTRTTKTPFWDTQTDQSAQAAVAKQTTSGFAARVKGLKLTPSRKVGGHKDNTTEHTAVGGAVMCEPVATLTYTTSSGAGVVLPVELANNQDVAGQVNQMLKCMDTWPNHNPAMLDTFNETPKLSGDDQ